MSLLWLMGKETGGERGPICTICWQHLGAGAVLPVRPTVRQLQIAASLIPSFPKLISRSFPPKVKNSNHLSSQLPQLPRPPTPPNSQPPPSSIPSRRTPNHDFIVLTNRYVCLSIATISSRPFGTFDNEIHRAVLCRSMSACHTFCTKLCLKALPSCPAPKSPLL